MRLNRVFITAFLAISLYNGTLWGETGSKVKEHQKITDPDPSGATHAANDLLGSSVSNYTKISGLSKIEGWVDVRTYESINAAVSALGSAATTLVVPNAQVLAGNLIIPSTLTLAVLPGGSVAKASTYTLTINGPLEAGPYGVFIGFSPGDITFGPVATTEVNPKWFGAKGDGTTDDSDALQSTFASVRANHLPVHFTSGRYFVRTPINATMLTSMTNSLEGIHIFGDGSASTQIIGRLSQGYPILDFTGSQGVHLERIGIIGDSAGSQTAAVLFAEDSVTLRGHMPLIENVLINGKFSKVSYANISADLSQMNHCTLYNTTGKVAFYGYSDAENVGSAYKTFGETSTKHTIYDSNFRAGSNVASAIRVDGCSGSFSMNDSYCSLGGKSGTQSMIEVTGINSCALFLKNVRMENDAVAGVAYHFVTFSSSGQSGFITGMCTIPSGASIFSIPSGKTILGYYLNVTVTGTPAGRLLFDGGGDIYGSVIINSQGLSATLGSASYGNIIYQGGSATPWVGISTGANLVMTNVTAFLYGGSIKLGIDSGNNDPIQMKVGGSNKFVTTGATDSCGAGYRCLRVPN